MVLAGSKLILRLSDLLKDLDDGQGDPDREDEEPCKAAHVVTGPKPWRMNRRHRALSHCHGSSMIAK